MPRVLLKDDFENLLDYRRWLQGAWDNLSPLNKGEHDDFSEQAVNHATVSRPNWYGSGVTYSELSAGITSYKKPELIEAVYNKVSHEINADIVNRIKKRKLDFNAMGLGVFCFDRAAMTLHRVKTPAGKTKVRTATKELFAWFPQEQRDRHAVELFVSCNAPASTKADDMLYGGVSAIIIAELLIKAGVRVKINMVVGSATDGSRNLYVGCVIPIKDYDEPFDRNLAALLVSDPRFIRFDGYKGVIAVYDHFKKAIPAGWGMPMNAVQLKTSFENSGYARNSQAQHRYYFGGTFSEQQATRDVALTITDLAQKMQQ